MTNKDNSDKFSYYAKEPNKGSFLSAEGDYNFICCCADEEIATKICNY